jgi:hypothetical protein
VLPGRAFLQYFVPVKFHSSAQITGVIVTLLRISVPAYLQEAQIQWNNTLIKTDSDRFKKDLFISLSSKAPRSDKSGKKTASVSGGCNIRTEKLVILITSDILSYDPKLFKNRPS